MYHVFGMRVRTSWTQGLVALCLLVLPFHSSKASTHSIKLEERAGSPITHDRREASGNVGAATHRATEPESLETGKYLSLCHSPCELTVLAGTKYRHSYCPEYLYQFYRPKVTKFPDKRGIFGCHNQIMPSWLCQQCIIDLTCTGADRQCTEQALTGNNRFPSKRRCARTRNLWRLPLILGP